MKRSTPFDTGWEIAAADWLAADGQGKKLGFSQLEWLPARVPGHVHLDLIRHGVIADPFQERAEIGCQWVDESSWVYRRRFDFSPDPALPRQLLRFEGLDTVCRVFLNGAKVAVHDDMFVPLEVDVTGRLEAGANELRVEFDPAARVGRERRAIYFAREGLPDDVVYFDERAFVRKAQYMFAWDWGPRLVSAGVWRDVALHEHKSRILDVYVRQEHLPGGDVELSLHGEVEGDGHVLHLVEGIDSPIADGQSVRLRRPELWWPAGLGGQRMYRVESFLVPAGVSRREELCGAALDRRSLKIGLRRLRLRREPDAQGESFEFEVNGVRLWAVGANWIPDHSFPSITDRPRLVAQLGRALDMNMNMLRVWGGGLYESDAFYELCDELGLLVWQDFPFACSHVPDDEPAQAALRVEAAANIRRLRNHPSLAIWCGNNENLMMWQSKWGGAARQPPRYHGEKLYEETLPEVLHELDPERPYIASSPIGPGQSAMPIGANANDGDFGDQHYWDVWHGRGDWKYYKDSTARFASEFGFASAPGRSVWQRIFPGDPEWSRRDVRDPGARWHDKTGKGYETYVGYVELHYPPSSDLEEFTYHSQLDQRDALRFGVEHFRRLEGCRGALVWQLNDCWPVQSWAVLDHDGVYKAAAFELRRLYAAALVSLQLEPGDPVVKVWTLLDNARAPVQGELVLEARRLQDGAVVERWARHVERQPGERGVSLEAPVNGLSAPDTLLRATFLGTTTFRLLSEPKDARIHAPRLAASRREGALVIEADRPVIDLFLWDPDGGLRLLDNYVTLPAAGQYVLRAEGRAARLCARSLAGRHPVRL